jgi:hypothetical protein
MSKRVPFFVDISIRHAYVACHASVGVSIPPDVGPDEFPSHITVMAGVTGIPPDKLVRHDRVASTLALTWLDLFMAFRTVARTHTEGYCNYFSDLPMDCPAGQRMNECGNLCQLTCEQHLTGQPMICPLVCGPPACSCPNGLALFRDRCVDPELCYVLVTCE